MPGFGPYSYLSAVPQFFFDSQILITFAFLASKMFTAVKQCIFLLGISILEKGWKWITRKWHFVKPSQLFILSKQLFHPRNTSLPHSFPLCKMTVWLCYWYCALTTFLQLFTSKVKYCFAFMPLVSLHGFRWMGSMHFLVSSRSSECFASSTKTDWFPNQ